MIGDFRLPLAADWILSFLLFSPRPILKHKIRQLVISNRKIPPKRTRSNIQLSINSIQIKMTVIFSRLNNKK